MKMQRGSNEVMSEKKWVHFAIMQIQVLHFSTWLFLAWSTYSQREELYMSEDTKNLARASSMTNGAWTRGEFVTCFRPPHVNWIRAKFGEMMQSSLCSNSSRCSKIILQIDPEKCQWAVGHLKLKGFPWCRSRLSPSVSKFLARVVECLWRSSWNWASEATLTFGSTRNNAEFYNERKLFETIRRNPFKPTRKYAYGGVPASIFVCKYLKVQCSCRHSCFHSDSTHAIDITCIAVRFFPRSANNSALKEK